MQSEGLFEGQLQQLNGPADIGARPVGLHLFGGRQPEAEPQALQPVAGQIGMGAAQQPHRVDGLALPELQAAPGQTFLQESQVETGVVGALVRITRQYKIMSIH